MGAPQHICTYYTYMTIFLVLSNVQIYVTYLPMQQPLHHVIIEDIKYTIDYRIKRSSKAKGIKAVIWLTLYYSVFKLLVYWPARRTWEMASLKAKNSVYRSNKHIGAREKRIPFLFSLLFLRGRLTAIQDSYIIFIDIDKYVFCPHG